MSRRLMLSVNFRFVIILLFQFLCGFGVCGAEVSGQEKRKMEIVVLSPKFRYGERIPVDYTGDGKDLSPPLRWSGVPKAARELVLIVDDPDAPTPEPWVHWVMYGIPAEVNRLDEGVASRRSFGATPFEMVHGRNSWNTLGYRGPAPPRGKEHRYFFRLYALDKEFNLGPGLDKASVFQKINGHIIAQGELLGRYSR